MNSQTCISISKERTSQSTDGRTGGRTECEEGVGKGTNGKAGGRDAEGSGRKEENGGVDRKGERGNVSWVALRNWGQIMMEKYMG